MKYSIPSYIWREIPAHVRVTIPGCFSERQNETLIECVSKNQLKEILRWIGDNYQPTEETIAMEARVNQVTEGRD